MNIRKNHSSPRYWTFYIWLVAEIFVDNVVFHANQYTTWSIGSTGNFWEKKSIINLQYGIFRFHYLKKIIYINNDQKLANFHIVPEVRHIFEQHDSTQDPVRKKSTFEVLFEPLPLCDHCRIPRKSFHRYMYCSLKIILAKQITVKQQVLLGYTYSIPHNPLRDRQTWDFRNQHQHQQWRNKLFDFCVLPEENWLSIWRRHLGS